MATPGKRKIESGAQVNAIIKLTIVAIAVFAVVTTIVAQEPVKVFVEEVRIPITAKDSNGHFDPTVEVNDLLVRENGVAQPLKSVYRTHASVLLLLDTGEELNRAKNVRLTREVAAVNFRLAAGRSNCRGPG